MTTKQNNLQYHNLQCLIVVLMGTLIGFIWGASPTPLFSSALASPSVSLQASPSVSSLTSLALDANNIQAVSTFHSIGLVWRPESASSDRTSSNSEATLQYRIEGDENWRQGHPLWYAGNGEYRGSLVELEAGTTYEVELSNGSETYQVSASTWREDFPIADTVYVENTDESFTVRQSGSAEGYILYMPTLGSDGVIDVAGRSKSNIRIDAHHVIIRGFTLKNAQEHAIRLDGNAHDVVIELNDISGWGRIDERDGWGVNQDAAIFSSEEAAERIIIQRNRIHHPRSDSNNWAEESFSTYGGRDHHPEGPQALYLGNSRGNHVIRYNEIYSDEEHKFNDCIGGGANGGRGFPGDNSDIYGNIIQDCWDDALEIEGYNQNVRVWGNYTNRTYMHIAARPTQEGPLYIWRNVADASRKERTSEQWDNDKRGHFLKSGNLNDKGGGRVYVYHNTMLQSSGPESLKLERSIGSSKGLSGAMRNYVSRNNIFYVLRGGDSILQEKSHSSNDFDFDLYNGELERISGHEANGIHGFPLFAITSGVSAANGTSLENNRDGWFHLLPTSPGYDAGLAIPNFSDQFTGGGPDMGAHEADSPAMQFGVGVGYGESPLPPDTSTTLIPPEEVTFTNWIFVPIMQGK